jgi:hypothetical protein
MRHFILLILLPFSAQAQDLTKVKRVSFKHTVGHYNFGDTGHYEKEEITEFVPISKNKFSRSAFIITKRYIANPETKENNLSISDTTTSKSDKYFAIAVFQSLVENLNRTKDNFKKENILPFLSTINKTEILSVAKNHDKDFWFIDDKNGKVDEVGKERIKKIKQFHFIDSFLIKQRPSLENEMVVIDAWNNLTISFCEQSDTTKYRFQFYELLGQPFSKTINNDFSHKKRFINSEVNNLLTKILPRNSFTEKAIRFDSLKDKYILWYIDNKMWDK